MTPRESVVYSNVFRGGCAPHAAVRCKGDLSDAGCPRAPVSSCLGLVAGLVAIGCHSQDFSPRTEPGEIDIYDDLFAVCVADEQHAVAVGYHGAAYWTDDGGDSWHKGETKTEELLYSVSMADNRHGWAVGQTGTILRTTDGGRTWELQPNLKVDEGSHLFGVQAVDANTAWAVGEWGTRIHTSDGGATWNDESLTITLGHPMFVWLSTQDQERVRKNEKVYEDVGLNNVFCLPGSQPEVLDRRRVRLHLLVRRPRRDLESRARSSAPCASSRSSSRTTRSRSATRTRSGLRSSQPRSSIPPT